MLNSILLFLGGIGAPEIILILLLVIVLFGAKKIPELAKGLGKGIKEFKDASKEINDDIQRESSGSGSSASTSTAPQSSEKSTVNKD